MSSLRIGALRNQNFVFNTLEGEIGSKLGILGLILGNKRYYFALGLGPYNGPKLNRKKSLNMKNVIRQNSGFASVYDPTLLRLCLLQPYCKNVSFCVNWYSIWKSSPSFIKTRNNSNILNKEAKIFWFIIIVILLIYIYSWNTNGSKSPIHFPSISRIPTGSALIKQQARLAGDLFSLSDWS